MFSSDISGEPQEGWESGYVAIKTHGNPHRSPGKPLVSHPVFVPRGPWTTLAFGPLQGVRAPGAPLGALSRTKKKSRNKFVASIIGMEDFGSQSYRFPVV